MMHATAHRSMQQLQLQALVPQCSQHGIMHCSSCAQPLVLVGLCSSMLG